MGLLFILGKEQLQKREVELLGRRRAARRKKVQGLLLLEGSLVASMGEHRKPHGRTDGRCRAASKKKMNPGAFLLNLPLP